MTSAKRDPYTVEDARRLLRGLRCDVDRPTVLGATKAGPPIACRVRYCCAAVGLEVLTARAREADPRCPCARAAGWAPELAEVTP